MARFVPWLLFAAAFILITDFYNSPILSTLARMENQTVAEAEAATF